MTDTLINFVGGTITGCVLWFFGGIDGLMKVLLTLAVVDYISGTLVGLKLKEISSSRGFWGITKKCMMFSLVGVAHLIDTIVPDGNGAFRAGVCSFYIAVEGTSIIENADKLGVKFPQALRKYFSKMKDSETHEQEINNDREKSQRVA